MQKILVTGATGQVGSAVIEALVREGINVRAASRKIAEIRATEHIEPILFDYEKPALFENSLSGISGIYLVAPPLDYDAPAKLIPFIDRAVSLGVRHIVFNSALGANASELLPLRVIEKHLIGSGIAYTIFRPNFFMENFSTGFVSRMIVHGEISLAAGEGKTSFISVRDIAEAAVIALSEKLHGMEYDLTGPEALSYGQVADIISFVSGIKVVYKAIPEEIMLQGARDMGMPEGAVNYMAMLFSAVRNGHMAVINSSLYELTEKVPITFDEFARKNSKYWRVSKAA